MTSFEPAGLSILAGDRGRTRQERSTPQTAHISDDTLLVILLHLPAGRHTAEVVRDALVEAMSRLPAHQRRSLTWDQGKEMALHGEIAQALGVPVFFCEKFSPWQRPSNENTNGLLRQYFPKGTDLRAHDADELAAVAAELNGRPRKTLDWDTPAEQFIASTPKRPTST